MLIAQAFKRHSRMTALSKVDAGLVLPLFLAAACTTTEVTSETGAAETTTASGKFTS